MDQTTSGRQILKSSLPYSYRACSNMHIQVMFKMLKSIRPSIYMFKSNHTALDAIESREHDFKRLSYRDAIQIPTDPNL